MREHLPVMQRCAVMRLAVFDLLAACWSANVAQSAMRRGAQSIDVAVTDTRQARISGQSCYCLPGRYYGVWRLARPHRCRAAAHSSDNNSIHCWVVERSA